MSDIRSVKPGDVLAWNRHGTVSASTVERVTKTQAITKGGSRWRLTDGCLVEKGVYCTAHIATADDIMSVNARNARNSIISCAHSLSDEHAIKVEKFMRSLAGDAE